MRNSSTIFALLSLFSGQVLFSQSVTWSGLSSRYQRVVGTHDGNIAIVSTYADSGLPSQKDTISYADDSGIILWQKVLPNEMRVTALTPASDEGLLVAGYYGGSFQFNGHQFNKGIYRGSLWFAKIAPNGSFAWVSVASGSSWDYVSDISCRSGSIAVCGLASDSIDFMGESRVLSSKANAFVATLDENGGLNDLYFSQPTTTLVGTKSFESQVLNVECGLNDQGSVHLLMRTYGRTLFDTIKVGNWNDYNEYGPHTSAIIKFDSHLTPQRATTLYSCYYYCRQFANFNVNAIGECFYTGTESYGQSGNDDMSCVIYKLNADGTPGGTFEVSQSEKNNLGDMQFDNCERLIFTGYKREYIYAPVVWYKFVVGRLNPDLSVNWVYEELTDNNLVWGTSLAVLKDGDLFVSGGFSDTIQFGSNPALISDYGGFYAHVNVPSSLKCTDVGIEKINNTGTGISLFPNPSRNAFAVRSDDKINSITVYSISGQKLLQTTDPNVNTSGLSSGVYLVKIETSLTNKTLRLIIQK